MKKLSDLVLEFSLKGFPDWNKIQLSIFRELMRDKSITLSEEDILKIGKVLRDHMNSNYFSGEWTVDKSPDELHQELLSIAKNNLVK